jgi:hypothetical protein
MNQVDEFWWREGVFYQIYPRSFQDSNDDGVGDIRGVINRLPYLLALGIDAIWISPIFPSPMADFGYDIADYTGIDRLFGSMADFEALVATAHGSSKAGAREITRSATGISGVSRRRTAGLRTIGCLNSAAAPGSTTPLHGNTTIMRFSPRSRI